MVGEAGPAPASEWTNESVRALTEDGDAVAVVTTLARRLMAAAGDAGLDGPPFDPLQLASLMGILVQPQADVTDAKISSRSGAIGGAGSLPAPLRRFVPTEQQLVLQFNPTRPRGRVRYSIAHELGHALFPDVAESTRHRTGSGAVPGSDDSWQLELLCNIVAAELLMPAEQVEGLVGQSLDIDFLMSYRRRFDVSTEALFRRIATVSGGTVSMFSMLRRRDTADDNLQIEYGVLTSELEAAFGRGRRFSSAGPIHRITAVGQTAREEASTSGIPLSIQAVGIPGYPGRRMPRVLALASPADASRNLHPALQYVSGNIADDVREAGPVIIAHITNDASRGWGNRGVAGALGARYQSARRSYQAWCLSSQNLTLGRVHAIQTVENPSVHIVSIVAQHGYGADAKDRLSYEALERGLESVDDYARGLGAHAAVHLPRLGAGQAGGRWNLVEACITETLLRDGRSVLIYTLPTAARV